MKFMILLKATKESEAGTMPSSEAIEKMGRFHEELAKDGVLIAAEGLWPSSKGTRLRFDGGRTTITDGPFAETKELVAGFWIVQGKSHEEVVERFSRGPFDDATVVEIRKVIEPEDFADLMTPEQRRRADTITLEHLQGGGT